MKRYDLVVVLALIFLFAGLQRAFPQADIAPDRGNAAPNDALPEELEALDVRDYYIASAAEPVGLIQTVTGHLVVLHGDTNQAYFAAKGDGIFRQDVLFTLEASRCRIKFHAEDVITIGEDTRIGIEDHIDDHEMKKKKSIISMQRGKAMFYVMRLFRYKSISTSVKTPTAVCGVRGTKFGVQVRQVSEKYAGTRSIYLADASDSGLKYLAAATPPNDTETVVYGFEGEVEVYSPVDGTTQAVGEGENLLVTGIGAGDVQSTDPGMAEQFVSDTEAPSPEGEDVSEDLSGGEGEQEESTKAEEEPQEEGTDSTVSTGTTDTSGDMAVPTDTVDTASVVQNQTTITIEEEVTDTVDQRPTQQLGYFSGMLTKDDGEMRHFKHLYLSNERQNFDSGNIVQGRDRLPDPDLIFEASGSEDYQEADLINLTIDDDTISADNFPFTIQPEEIGHNAYMEWGYWTQPQAMQGSSGANYSFDNKGYYIYGEATTNTRMNSLASNDVSGTYNGNAYGTYWTLEGGEDMAGTFSAHVDFSLRAISNFKVDVSGPSHRVLISGASGNIVENLSHFEVNTDGTWQIDGMDAGMDGREAYGSVYGPNGEAIGGVWKIDEDSHDAHATGNFQGTR